MSCLRWVRLQWRRRSHLLQLQVGGPAQKYVAFQSFGKPIYFFSISIFDFWLTILNGAVPFWSFLWHKQTFWQWVIATYCKQLQWWEKPFCPEYPRIQSLFEGDQLKMSGVQLHSSHQQWIYPRLMQVGNVDISFVVSWCILIIHNIFLLHGLLSVPACTWIELYLQNYHIHFSRLGVPKLVLTHPLIQMCRSFCRDFTHHFDCAKSCFENALKCIAISKMWVGCGPSGYDGPHLIKHHGWGGLLQQKLPTCTLEETQEGLNNLAPFVTSVDACFIITYLPPFYSDCLHKMPNVWIKPFL